MRLARVVAFLVLFLALQIIPAHGQQVVATWTDSSGNWSNAANWSTNPIVPNNSGGTTYNAVINGTGADTITFDASGTAVSGLTLGTGETFQDNGLSPALTVGSLTNNGTINWGNGSSLNLGGGSTNNGNFNIDASQLRVTGNFNQNNSFTLSNGSVGSVSGSFINNNYQGSLATIDGSSLSVKGDVTTNTNNLTVQNGGLLNVGGNYNTYAGQLSITSGSTVSIASGFSALQGFSQGGGLLLDHSSLTVGSGFGSGLFSFMTTIGNGSTVLVNGGANILNNGQFNVSGGSSVLINGPLFNGEGSSKIDNSSVTVKGNISNNTSGWTFVQNGGFLNSTGTFSIDNAGSFLKLVGSGNSANLNAVMNGGLVQVDSGSSLTVTSGGFSNGSCQTACSPVLNLGGNIIVSGGFTNSGSVSILSTGNLRSDSYTQGGGLTDISGALFSQSYSQTGGKTVIETGGKLTTTTFSATGGTVTVNGNLDPTAVEFGSGATLNGTGMIVGNVAMGGILAPGTPGTPGVLTIVGNYEQLSGGMLQELMGPLSQSFLHVTGNVTLDPGSFLSIILANGYDPIGQNFTILQDGSLEGQFTNGSVFWQDGYQWDLIYGPNGVELTAVGTPEPGSLLLLGLGSLAIGALAKRKKVAQ